MPFLPASSVNAIYGDGHDGDVTISADTQLEATLYANNLTVQAGFSLYAAEWPIYVRGTLTVEATAVIHADGVDATAGVGGQQDAQLENYGALIAGQRGGDGGIADNGTLARSWYHEDLGLGGSGGDAGYLGGGNVFGGDPWLNLQRSSLGGGTVATNFDGADIFDSIQARLPYAGMGGGSGGAGAGDTGGGGGMGGSVLLIAAHRVVNSGTIRSAGGTGGNATAQVLGAWATATAYADGVCIKPAGSTHAYRSSGGTSGGAQPTWPDDDSNVTDNDITWDDLGVQGGGGGGGGQGGLIVLIYDYYSGTALTAATNCPGGAGGTKTGSGVNGEAGDVGIFVNLANR